MAPVLLVPTSMFYNSQRCFAPKYNFVDKERSYNCPILCKPAANSLGMNIPIGKSCSFVCLTIHAVTRKRTEFGQEKDRNTMSSCY